MLGILNVGFYQDVLSIFLSSSDRYDRMQGMVRNKPIGFISTVGGGGARITTIGISSRRVHIVLCSLRSIGVTHIHPEYSEYALQIVSLPLDNSSILFYAFTRTKPSPEWSLLVGLPPFPHAVFLPWRMHSIGDRGKD